MDCDMGQGAAGSPWGSGRRGALRDGARQVSAGGSQQRQTTSVLQTFARGVSQRSRSIFSAAIEGEDIAAYGSECDIGSDTC